MPKRNEYRRFNIRSHEGADDYSSMREVLYRRIENALAGEAKFLPLPDLILIDGGKGHISAAQSILDFHSQSIPLFGVVKDDKHRTRGLIARDIANNFFELAINRQSSTFKFLTRVQDEVHRFAITTHRAKHAKSTIGSELTKISGVGEKKKNILLKHFKSIDKIKNADIAELSAITGIDKRTAEAVYNYFR
jgi:excinuclease ABC subunit C